MNEIEEEKVELKILGKHVQVLPKQKIIEKIEEVDENLDEYVKKAWENHIPSAVDTDVVVNLGNGKVEYANYEPNCGPILDPSITHLSMTLFTISHRTSANTIRKDLYTDEELEELEEMINNGEIEEHEEYAEKKGIDLDERYVVNIAGYIREDELGFDYSYLIEKVNKIYENEVKS